VLIESGAVRHATLMRRAGSAIAAAVFVWLVVTAGQAMAQEPPQITPNISVTPSKVVTPWIYQMAIGAAILGALILLGVVASYLRFSPKFFGKDEAPARTSPGARPPLVRQPAYERPAVAAHAAAPQPTAAAAAPAPAATATATAVMEGPPSEPEPSTQPEPAAQPEAEPATEPKPKPEPATEPKPEPDAPSPPVQAAAGPAPAPAASAESAMDQETFDRVLQEQIDKGMDRRVAEGRARAAAVVAARKKAQG
jgi:outer membrane biosynthesis protein TonB